MAGLTAEGEALCADVDIETAPESFERYPQIHQIRRAGTILATVSLGLALAAAACSVGLWLRAPPLRRAAHRPAVLRAEEAGSGLLYENIPPYEIALDRATAEEELLAGTEPDEMGPVALGGAVEDGARRPLPYRTPPPAPSMEGHHVATTQTTTTTEGVCQTACPGDPCHDNVMWAMNVGIKEHPDWYPGLRSDSSFTRFQFHIAKSNGSKCEKPCLARLPTSCPRAKKNCLCVFDVDRTLTARQGSYDRCKGTRRYPGVHDTAFGGGDLLLSEFAVNLRDTFCAKCYRATASAGVVSGGHSKMRSRVLDVLGGVRWTLSSAWSGPAPHVTSSLVVGAQDGHKHHSVRGIIEWFGTHRNVHIEDDQVHFFDDKADNVRSFTGMGFNARQISCGSRGGDVGLCGARSSEVVPESGVALCSAGPTAKRTETPASTTARAQAPASGAGVAADVPGTDLKGAEEAHGPVAGEASLLAAPTASAAEPPSAGPGAEEAAMPMVGEISLPTVLDPSSGDASKALDAAPPAGVGPGDEHEALRAAPPTGSVPGRGQNGPLRGHEACHTACPGEKCYTSIIWAMTRGIHDHPTWYPGLTAASGLREFQDHLAKGNRSGCAPPCEETRPNSCPTEKNCLCVFDVDRTLTAKQGAHSTCPGTKVMPGITDSAFAGGDLVLSELAANINETFCKRCFRGLVTNGNAGGTMSPERAVLLEVLGDTPMTLSKTFSMPHPQVTSTLVIGAADGTKQDSVRGIVEWLKTERNVRVKDSQVFYFDDNSLNVLNFMGFGFSARQVSCASREGHVGLCGGRSSEVVDTSGVLPYCPGQGAAQSGA